MWDLVNLDEASFSEPIPVQGRSRNTCKAICCLKKEFQRGRPFCLCVWIAEKWPFTVSSRQIYSLLVLHLKPFFMYVQGKMHSEPSPSHSPTLPTPACNWCNLRRCWAEGAKRELHGDWALLKSSLTSCLASAGRGWSLCGLAELGQKQLEGCREQILRETVIKSKQC